MNLFVQVPLAILEADMPATHKIGIQHLIYTCWRDHCTQVRGSYRSLAKLLHLAKTSFMSRILPKWVELGWVRVQEQGKEVILTLLSGQLQCPILGQGETAEPDQAVTTVPDEDTNVPKRDKVGPPRDKSVPLVSSKASTVRREITESLPEESREEENVTCLLKKEEWDTIPELTPELGLDLVRDILPVPPRPKSGRALEMWMQKWYEPMAALIADLRPITGPLAWAEIDELVRFQSSPESGWMKTIGRLPTLENVYKNRHIQHEQMAKLGWQPEARTPYPGVPAQDTTDEQEWDTAEQTPLAGIRNASPFANFEEQEAFAEALQQANPTLLLSADDDPEGPGPLVLLVQHGPDDYLCIDPEIWNHPTSEELELLYQAIDYGQYVSMRQPEAVAI